ncbi:MAG: hypothetical protein M0P31_18970, partial [Solirubrobacteraceae bacterium]|nr:hypothetical protein [Solirubrobacteraceae bacterium]
MTADYPVRLGPLRFRSFAGDMTEALGDTLTNVGAALVPGERRPRPQRLVLPVTGNREPDPREAGLRLRRQVRQLLENAAWKQQGLY